jgi:hypothetical protein
MTRSRRFAHISLGSARWLLPWTAVLFVSVTLAHAMGSAIDGGSSAANDQPEVQAVLSTGEASEAPELEQSATSLPNTAIQPYGSRVGVMSMTSPASTGHASPNGCCTWD